MLKITTAHLARSAGRRFVLDAKKKLTLGAVKAENPWTITKMGTPADQRLGENNRHHAWYSGALEAMAEFVPVSKRKPIIRSPRAQARHDARKAKLAA